VRQIGLRNLSGMIIVDFINLKEKAEEEQLVSALKKIYPAGKHRNRVC